MSISVGSVAVDVVPDTRRFATELKAKLRDVTADIRLDADTTALRAKIDEVTRPRTVAINANADTAAAEAKLDAVARDRTSNLGIGGIGAAASGIFSLGGAIAALGPALIPISAAIAGIGGALVAPLAVAGGGLTVGALIAGFAIADTKKQQKVLEELQKKVQSAKTAVETASTPAGKKSAMVREAEAVKAYQTALAELSPAQKRFIDSEDKLKGSFQKLLTTAGPAIFGPLIQGMDLLSGVLPKLKPLLQGVADGVGSLLDDLGKAASGPGFTAFIKSFGSTARSTIETFGHIFGDVSSGLVSFFRAFAPLSKSFVGAISGAAAGFATWAASLGSSKSFQSFLGYVKDVGPKVAQAFGDIFGALGNVAVVLAPLGGLVLTLVDGLAKFVRDVKPGQLAAIAGAIGAIGLAVLFATGGVSGIVPAILGLGGGLAYAYGHSVRFRGIVDGIGRVFNDHLLPALRDAWHTVLPGLLKGFDNVKQSIHDNQGLFTVLGDVFKIIGAVLVDIVIPAVALFYSKYLPLLGKAIGLGITTVRLLALSFADMALVAVQSFKLLVSSALTTFGGILKAAAVGLGWIPGIGKKIRGAQTAFGEFKDNSIRSLDHTADAIKGVIKTLDNIKPKTIRVKISPFIAKPVSSLFGPGITVKPEGAGARGAIINRPTVALIGENGPERLTPLDQTAGNSPLSASGGATGAQFHVDTVVAQDVNDFLRQMQTRSRLASLGGGRP